MVHTNSLAFPNMFSVSKNTVNIVENDVSVVNRVRLLMLSDPTSLYNSPTFGVGLKRYLFQYNNDNTKAQLKDRIKEQLRMYEPCVDADKTTFTDGLLYTGSQLGEEDYTDVNRLKMTMSIKTIYGDTVDINTNDMIEGE